MSSKPSIPPMLLPHLISDLDKTLANTSDHYKESRARAEAILARLEEIMKAAKEDALHKIE